MVMLLLFSFICTIGCFGDVRCSDSMSCKLEPFYRFQSNLDYLCIKQLTLSKTSKPCDSECEKFRELMRAWPHEKPKAAVVILTQPKKLRRIQKMLKNLDLHFLNEFHYPIIIFHEEDYRRYVDDVRTYTNASVFFQEVEFAIPHFINRTAMNFTCWSRTGYRHMCRFFSKTMYKEPILDGLEFIFRLDDDSNITHPVKYDLIQYMKQHNKSYGYAMQTFDASKCVYGLWDAVRDYIEKHGIKPTFFHTWKFPAIFYNNFEISRSDFWMGRDYQGFIEYLDGLGGIYYNRWGDAPIKTLALSLFMPKDKIHHFDDIGYKHAGVVNKPKN